jgi:hypothetical protein
MLEGDVRHTHPGSGDHLAGAELVVRPIRSSVNDKLVTPGKQGGTVKHYPGATKNRLPGVMNLFPSVVSRSESSPRPTSGRILLFSLKRSVVFH